MKYDILLLTEKIRARQKVKYLSFWGHQPNKDGSISSTCLSQWWRQPFSIDDVVYSTAEHWMMAQKALLFGDIDIYSKIVSTNTPGEAKDLGRKVQNFDPEIWEANRFEIVVRGNLNKFTQHKDLQDFLINTNDRILVEASPVDYIWGIGMAYDNPDAHKPKNWNGLNLLGFALMEARDILKDGKTHQGVS